MGWCGRLRTQWGSPTSEICENFAQSPTYRHSILAIRMPEADAGWLALGQQQDGVSSIIRGQHGFAERGLWKTLVDQEVLSAVRAHAETRQLMVRAAYCCELILRSPACIFSDHRGHAAFKSGKRVVRIPEQACRECAPRFRCSSEKAVGKQSRDSDPVRHPCFFLPERL
jgi:hypothetical protein